MKLEMKGERSGGKLEDSGGRGCGACGEWGRGCESIVDTEY